ncbi:uncharacterized protein LOC143024698 [Oratosquilla oratoria]|uniref:uncharacterized protein LOC143024698 n=1 Tax=Oratosquilla oratoria TaxID=337810 RepID=UPI003F76047A
MAYVWEFYQMFMSTATITIPSTGALFLTFLSSTLMEWPSLNPCQFRLLGSLVVFPSTTSPTTSLDMVGSINLQDAWLSSGLLSVNMSNMWLWWYNCKQVGLTFT